MPKRILLLTFAIAAITTSALTGSAAASTTLGGLAPTETGPGGCTLCTFVQVGTNPAGPSYVVPNDGVVTSISIAVGSKVTPNSSVNFLLLHHVFSNSYAIDTESGLLPIPAAAAATTLRYPTRITVRANQLLGQTINSGTGTPSGNTPPFYYTSSTSDLMGTLPAGTNLGEATNLNGPPSQQRQLNMQAVLEPDADKDGYGDETQDCFSNDSKNHVAVCPDTVAPVISSLKTKHAKFLVNKKGALVIAKSPRGTTFSYTCSEGATVTYTVSRVSKSAKTKKTTLKTVHSFKRAAVSGANSVAYSGRFRDAKKRKTALKPGKYKLTATPVDAARNIGSSRSVSFTVTS